MKTRAGTEMSDLRIVAEARVTDPMNTWPDHNEWHKRNTHPFSGSQVNNLYWDEECLRCQLESVAAEKAKLATAPFKDRQIAER